MNKSSVLALGAYSYRLDVNDGAESEISLSRTKYPEKISYPLEGIQIKEEDLAQFSITIGPLEYVIDPGVLVILAPTQWGKTIFVTRVLLPELLKGSGLAADSAQFISFVEPFENISFGADYPGIPVIWSSTHEQLFSDLAHFIISDKKICVIDSLRSFIYDASVGGTGAGGMDTYLPIQLTALSNLMASFGKLLIVTINPMLTVQTEDERLKFVGLQQRIESSVPAVFTGLYERVADVALRGLSNLSTSKFQYNVPTVDLQAEAQRQTKTVTALPVPMVDKFTPINLLGGTVSNL